MRTYIKSHNSIAIHATFILLALVFLVTTPAFANSYTLNPVLDYSDEDSNEGGDTWSYICELDNYQAWFGFDVSAIPDGVSILSASFTAYMANEDVESSQRTIWYEPNDSWIQDTINPGDKSLTELVGTAMDSGDWEWVTFDLDISKHTWGNDLIDNYISLMVTGPLSGEHECGEMDLTESGNLPSLEITTVPEPATICLLGLGALSLIRRKR